MRARWIVLPRRLMLLALLLGRKSDLRGRLAAAAAALVVALTDTPCARTACTSSAGTAIAARGAVATTTTTTATTTIIVINLAARDEAAHLLPGDAQLAAHLAAGGVALVAVGALPAVPAESAHGWD